MSSSQTTLDFAHAARLLGREARRRGLVAPSFRCPPRIVGVQRSVRRHRTGAVVAVQLKGRPWLAVLADMIEGVVVANELDPQRAARLRTDLWAAAGGEVPAVPVGPSAVDPDEEPVILEPVAVEALPVELPSKVA